MKKNNDSFMNIPHTILTGAFCMTVMIIGRVSPLTIIPRLTMPVMAGLLLVALVIETYVKGRTEKRNLPLAVGLSTACYAVFPYVSGMAEKTPLWKFFAGGLIVSVFVIVLYDSIMERTFADGKKHLLAPAANAMMLFLAAQALYGIF